MKKQRGAALVVVLSLLAMSLMLGISGMQSSQIDERLAGNYRSS
ncbi:MAG: PilX N-terminal domain-containing pilus assembly protein, partial [Billgrantia desiderata]